MTTHVGPELLTGYLDRELGADQSQDVERHLAQCRDCKTVYETMLETQRRVRGETPRFTAPAALRRRIAGQVRGATTRARPRFSFPW